MTITDDDKIRDEKLQYSNSIQYNNSTEKQQKY